MINKSRTHENGKRSILRAYLPAVMCAATLSVFFVFLFAADNKYRTAPPYGSHGVVSLTKADITRHTPLFLIDGWLLTDGRSDRLPTYIGQFGNLQRGDRTASPHGTAEYEIVLPMTAARWRRCCIFLCSFPPTASGWMALFWIRAKAAREFPSP